MLQEIVFTCMHTYAHTHTHTHTPVALPIKGIGQDPGSTTASVQFRGRKTVTGVGWPGPHPTALGRVAAARHGRKMTVQVRQVDRPP